MTDSKASVMAAMMLCGSVAIAGSVLGEDAAQHAGRNVLRARLDVAPVNNNLYKKECGSCHFAYQPGLLPVRSWQKIMNTLEDHFGDNAELASDDQKSITDYLVATAAGDAGYKAAVKILQSVAAADTPVAISKTRYFVSKHDEVPAQMVTGNPQVKSFAHCARCHTNADKGSYAEREVNIPGYGRGKGRD